MTKGQPLPNVVGTPTPEDPVGKLKFGRSTPDNALPGTEGQKCKNKDKDKAERNRTTQYEMMMMMMTRGNSAALRQTVGIPRTRELNTHTLYVLQIGAHSHTPTKQQRQTTLSNRE